LSLPVSKGKRKMLPIYSGVLRYFPDALAAVAELSMLGNEQHNPGSPLHWDRSKSGDELDALCRHLVECGTTDTDGALHDTKVAWRALANLQKVLEKPAWPEKECANPGQVLRGPAHGALTPDTQAVPAAYYPTHKAWLDAQPQYPNGFPK
jgi:phage tail protein X